MKKIQLINHLNANTNIFTCIYNDRRSPTRIIDTQMQYLIPVINKYMLHLTESFYYGEMLIFHI